MALRRPKRLLVFTLVLALCGAIGIGWFNITEILTLTDENPKDVSPANSSSSSMKSLTEQKTTSSSTSRKQSWGREGDLEEEYRQRRLQSQPVCGQTAGQKGDVFMWTKYKDTAYCILPKVGCTFWKSVFRFLHGDTGGNYTSPFLIPRKDVHTGPMRSMK